MSTTSTMTTHPHGVQQRFQHLVTHLVINLIQQGLTSPLVNRQEPIFPFGASHTNPTHCPELKLSIGLTRSYSKALW